jgi:hypothetical protein
MYESLEQLLFRGFITVRVKAQGITIVLKSMNMREFEWANEIMDGVEDLRHLALSQLAVSIYRLNGRNVLMSREEHVFDLIDTLAYLSPSVVMQLFQAVQVLNSRAVKISERLVPFMYGTRSKVLWTSYKGHLLCDPKVTGIEGTQYLGLNEVQKNWCYLHTLDDQHVIFERQYDMAKFIVSPHTKEIKKINEQDRQMKFDEQERRQRIHEQGFDDGFERTTEIVATTPAEMKDQIERTLRGEKDFHDMVVENYLNKVRAKMDRERREAATIAASAKEAWDQMYAGDQPVPKLRPLSPKEVQEELALRRQSRHDRLIHTPDHVENHDDERERKFLGHVYGGDRVEEDFLKDTLARRHEE